MPSLILTLILTLGLAACSLPVAGDDGLYTKTDDYTPTDVLGRPAYASRAREVEHELRTALLEVTRASQDRAASIRVSLAARLSTLSAPARLATSERYLSTLLRAEVKAYEQAVALAYDEALLQLDELHESSIQQALSIAASMAPERSPLDVGPTGSPLLDRQVTAFEETLRLDLRRSEMEAEGYRLALRRLELLVVFNSFNAEGADDAMGGRLLVLVGGDEGSEPRVDVVFRADEGVDAEDRGLLQAVRFRVMAGDTVVEDLGWRPLPAPDGRPQVAQDGRYLLAPESGPLLQSAFGSPEDLMERRVVADVQTAVFDREGVLLGGADWRLEYRVSLRGRMSWQVGAVEPRFNAACTQVAEWLPEHADD
ncbi:MAG: hypothetical protein DRQ55_07695 [Planctomycetota bacterium]|nr:MAG: hypothetical protein DRQ55_07695 [Planctomycetota bacterium]